MIEPLLAGFVLALCVVALARLALGERRRARWDAAAHRTWMRLAQRLRRGRPRPAAAATGSRAAGSAARAASGRAVPGRTARAVASRVGGAPDGAGERAAAPSAGGLAGLWRRLRQRAAQRAAEKQAAREAEALIRRARDGRWEGNVYRPKAFDTRPPRRSEESGRGPRDTLH